MTSGIVTPHDTAPPSIWDTDACIIFEIDATIYPLAAIIAAGYKFTDRAFVWLQSSQTTGRYLAFLKPKNSVDEKAALAGAFINEMLDQALRYQLEQQFAPVRTLLTAQAFAEGNLLDFVIDAEHNK